MRPPAPGLFSTTPGFLLNALPAHFSATRRATVSPELPAGKPKYTFTWSTWAWAAKGWKAPSAALAPRA